MPKAVELPPEEMSPNQTQSEAETHILDGVNAWAYRWERLTPADMNDGAVAAIVFDCPEPRDLVQTLIEPHAKALASAEQAEFVYKLSTGSDFAGGNLAAWCLGLGEKTDGVDQSRSLLRLARSVHVAFPQNQIAAFGKLLALSRAKAIPSDLEQDIRTELTRCLARVGDPSSATAHLMRTWNDSRSGGRSASPNRRPGRWPWLGHVGQNGGVVPQAPPGVDHQAHEAFAWSSRGTPATTAASH
jgi:hypothetical protein